MKQVTAGEYEQAAAYVQLLAARLRAVLADAQRTDADAKAAIERNAAQHVIVSELVQVYRALCAALADSAGVDRRYSLSDCIADARALLERA